MELLYIYIPENILKDQQISFSARRSTIRR